ncbi:chromosome segregation and condensation protein ScpA [Methanocaldococcus vulcanius M7]|uniref:Chromosome segregation and condensation protein ScpA n=1 Tax=Methanocaldococcus vulcanius (strain ATCC 700851 / DSM 12094 / M7) TaxID=579137 RepID=C9RH60_METVM|nr:segregation/condensation protein A [Methanocaldococcus vulcanius]ACX72912.1 chromosome segregation and condensation protein ScpA [Methanocaldococcus vulcanius M7]
MVHENFDIVLWIRMIKEGIEKKNLNPWDVNIAEIADYYLQKIRELKKFDIRLSADVVLVAGILLRMKSQALYEEVNEEEEEEEYFEEDIYEEPEDRKQRKSKSKGKKSKSVSVDELIETIEKELKKVKKSRKKKEKKIIDVEEIVEELIEEEDVSDIINELLYDLEKEGIIIYQKKFKTKNERVRYFLPSLYLANDGKAELIQEKLFGELIIKIKNKKIEN